jgi:hypothetical protein
MTRQRTETGNQQKGAMSSIFKGKSFRKSTSKTHEEIEKLKKFGIFQQDLNLPPEKTEILKRTGSFRIEKNSSKSSSVASTPSGSPKLDRFNTAIFGVELEDIIT